MQALVKLISQFFRRPAREPETWNAPPPTAAPAPIPHSGGAAASPATTLPQVTFVAFQRGTGGFHVKCRDAAGRDLVTSPLERMEPLGNGWFVAHTSTGNRYQLFLTPQQFSEFQALLRAPAGAAQAVPASTPPLVPTVQARGFQRGPQGLHFRLTDRGGRELVSSPVLRVEPQGNGWFQLLTTSGSRYLTYLTPALQQEFQRLTRPEASAPPQSSAPSAPPPPATPTVRPSAPTTPSPRTQPEPIPRPPAQRTLTWAGAGVPLALKNWTIPNPLVYWSEGDPRLDEASCIDLHLPIGPPRSEPPGALGYWPRYRGMSPEQRGNYLAWLAQGRQMPARDVGYAFVFFYGLERRVLVDGADLYPALSETARLLEQYPLSQSFQVYGRGFIAYALAKAGLENLPESWFTLLVKKPALQNHPEGLAVALAWLALKERPLPAVWAHNLAARLESSQQSVVVERVPEQFAALFAQKYAARYGDGLLLRCAKRDHACSYHPGSPSFASLRNREKILAPARIPNVQGITSQFKPLAELWNACVEELRPLSRQVGKGVSVSTRAAYDALPEALKATTEHPDTARWHAVAARHWRSTGKAVVPVSELAPLLDLPAGTKLTPKQGQELASTAQGTGFAVEPDARLTRRGYGAEERVILYREERAEIESSGRGDYPAAALILELGLALAAADGEIDAAEVAHVTQFVEGQFELAPAQRRRLEALESLFREAPPSLSGIGSRLQALLSPAQREELTTFLVGVAAANGSIDRAETGMLRKAARALGSDPAHLDTLLAELVWSRDDVVEVQRGGAGRPGEALPSRPEPAEPAPPQVVLNEELLRSIMQDTRHVAQMLTEAMGEADEAEARELEAQEPDETRSPERTGASDPAPPPETSASPPPAVDHPFDFAGLDSRYHAVLAELLTAESWPASEFQAAVRRHGLFPAGALAVVNEWAEEYLGDLLIEEGDPFCLQRELVKERE